MCRHTSPGDRNCYHGCVDVLELEQEARAADDAAREARARLVSAVRRAHASGLSQREIAAHSGRSQAEINRLLRFHGAGERARQLRANRGALVRLLRGAGLVNVRVFGSVARGQDHEGSDVDILASPRRPIGLLALARLENEASRAVGLPVDLVLDDSIRPDLRARILEEAVPL